MGWDFLNTLLLLDLNNKQDKLLREQQRAALRSDLEKCDSVYNKLQQILDQLESHPEDFGDQERIDLRLDAEDLLDQTNKKIDDLNRKLRKLN